MRPELRRRPLLLLFLLLASSLTGAPETPRPEGDAFTPPPPPKVEASPFDEAPPPPQWPRLCTVRAADGREAVLEVWGADAAGLRVRRQYDAAEFRLGWEKVDVSHFATAHPEIAALRDAPAAARLVKGTVWVRGAVSRPRAGVVAYRAELRSTGKHAPVEVVAHLMRVQGGAAYTVAVRREVLRPGVPLVLEGEREAHQTGGAKSTAWIVMVWQDGEVIATEVSSPQWRQLAEQQPEPVA